MEAEAVVRLKYIIISLKGSISGNFPPIHPLIVRSSVYIQKQSLAMFTINKKKLKYFSLIKIGIKNFLADVRLRGAGLGTDSR